MKKITNAWICRIKGHEVVPVFGDIIYDEGIIKEIRPVKFQSFLFNRRRKLKSDFDAGGRVITIPLVNFHEHVYSRLAKGLPVKGKTDNFTNILSNLWWKIDRALSPDMLTASAEMAVIESIKNGVTYIFDHHSSPNSAEKSLNQIAKVIKGNKLRGVLAFETTDRNGKRLAQNGLRENKNFFLRFTGTELKAMFGLHASFTLENETLKDVSDFINDYDLGIHIHLCEDQADRTISKRKTGRLPLQRLIKFNLLNERSILSHAIHLTKNELNKIAEFGSAVALNPDSNLNNSVGFPKEDLFNLSIPLLAGTDGMHANPGRTIKNTFLLLRNAGLSFEQVFGIINKIYFDQIKFVKRYFPDYTGLNKGERADFVVWDYIPPTPINSENFFGHFVYGMLESKVHSMIQNGEFLLTAGKLNQIDEENVFRNIYKQGEKLYSKMKRIKR